MAIKYISIFQAKALKNLPKLGFFGLKMNHLATQVMVAENPIANFCFREIRFFSKLRLGKHKSD
jgi:hypothetical protein